MATYSKTIEITEETSYDVVINSGLNLQDWISAGSTTEHPLNPSSYADFAALEADEEAIRQLMTVHASVDYLAQATAGDSLMEDIINSDVCAKWINLRDYALDTLYANSDIASEMDTADKYFYGEWVENSGTWGAKGNVPIMTSLTAPYGMAGLNVTANNNPAWKAFDGDDSTFAAADGSVSSLRLIYIFNNPINVRRIKIKSYNSNIYDGLVVKVGYTDDGSTWQESTESVTLTGGVEATLDIADYGYHLEWCFSITNSGTANNCAMVFAQFYGREMKPISLINNGSASSSGGHYSDSTVEANAFDGSKTTKWMSAGGGSLQEYIAWTFPKNTKVEYISICAGSGTYAPSVLNSIMAEKSGSSSFETIKSNVQLSGVNPTLIDISDADSYAVYRFFIPTKLSGGKYYTEMAEIQFFAFDYSEKEFASNSNRLTIYDHGVEVVALDSPITAAGATAEKQSYQLYGYEPASGTPSYAFTTSQAVNFPSGKYSRLVGRVGNTAYGANVSQSVFYYGLKVGKTWSYNDKTLTAELGVTPTTLASGSLENGVDISSVTGDYFVMFSSISNTQLRYASCEELWLE